MRRTYLFLITFILIVPLLGAGCINLTTSKTVDGGIFRSDDSGETWSQKVFIRKEKKKTISINNVNVGMIVFHPTDKNIIYLGTLGDGLYRSKNAGEQWESFGINSGSYDTISIDPETPEIIYTATGSSILKTSDDGKSWETIYLEPRGQKIVSVNVDIYKPSQIYAATQDGEIVQSIDYGETWATLSSLAQAVKKLYINPKDTRIIYAVTGNNRGIYRSVNAGVDWNALNTDLEKKKGAITINFLDFTDQEPEKMYLATNYGLFRSENGGSNWNEITTLFPFGSVPIQTVAVNPNNHSEIYFTIGKVVHKTTDNSITWKTIETFPSARKITNLIINPENTEQLYAGTYLVKKK